MNERNEYKSGSIRRAAVRVGAILLGTLVLGACIMEPSDDDPADGGSITISVPVSGSSLGGSSISGSSINSASKVRVWMYTPEGNEYRLAPTGTGIPNALNYVETTGGGSVTIKKIPAGDGYGIVVAIDEDGGSTFAPTAYAFKGSFSVQAGRETQLSLSLERLGDRLTTGLAGKDLNSVVEVGTEIFSGSDDGVYKNFTSTPKFSTAATVSRGRDSGGSPVLLMNTRNGIAYSSNGNNVDATYAGIDNVTGSGTFLADTDDDNDDEVVVYYQRLGGLGGGSGETIDALFGDTDAWNDSGDDLSEVIADDESPIWSAAASDTAAYISSVIGTFRATDELFTGADIDVDELLGGDSDTAGLSFFGVAYPGTDRALRIRHIAVAGDNVIVGTGRGAFYFPESAIDDADGGLVSNVRGVRDLVDTFIVDMAVDAEGRRMVAITPSRVVLAEPDGAVLGTVPLRAVSLGNPRDVFLAGDAASPEVLIAGTEGLSRIVFSTD
ncbi:MAG: hypothetical protein ACOC2V_03615 [Alkalispirochaeta sp.]